MKNSCKQENVDGNIKEDMQMKFFVCNNERMKMNMNEMMINEELVAENSDFLKAVVGAKTVEEAQKVCAEYNIELTDDVWKEVQNSYSDGELGEDEMDTVAGGKVNSQYLLQTLGGIVGLGDVIAAGVLGLATTATRHSGD